MANSGRCAIPEPQESTTCRQAYVCFLFRCYSEPIYNFIGFFGREWGPLTASATLAILPILIAFALLGRLIVAGLTKGSVKG